MYVIAGLGNPGKEYENTRHNVGFMTIDALAGKYNIKVREMKHKGLVGTGHVNGEKVMLVKPLTYMNLSGECIGEVLRYYKIEEEKLIVISDDIDLEPGRLRIRAQGSAGGHNGLKNIIAHLGNDNFVRIRIGVGAKPIGGDLADHVLGHLAGDDEKLINSSIDRAIQAIEYMVDGELNKAMNQFNGKA